MKVPDGSERVKRTAAALLAAIGWVALVLQYLLQLRVATGDLGLTMLEANVRFVSYFTIQSNIIVAAVLTAYALGATGEKWLARPFVRSAVAVYIAVVGLIYTLVLRDLWHPQGAQWLADVALHDVMPLAYLLFWFVAMRKDGLHWRDALLWLIYPAAYLAAILLRGQLSGFYPYPFIDAGHLGYAKTAANAAGMLAVFVVVGAIVVMAGRATSRATEK